MKHKKKRNNQMQKVQEVSLLGIEDPEFLKEEYESLGFTVKRVGESLECYWGTPRKPKKEKVKVEEPEHKPGQEKTARRLGR
jgi:hypothetical protein